MSIQAETCRRPCDRAGRHPAHCPSSSLPALGVSQIAYVKPVMMNGALAYAIHAADGTPMAVAGDRDVAIAAVHQHEMVVSLVH